MMTSIDPKDPIPVASKSTRFLVQGSFLLLTMVLAVVPACKKKTPTSGSSISNSAPNIAPSPGTLSVSPIGTGLAALTNFSFHSVGATDEDSDPLTFAWDFGDGSTGTGRSTTHVFNAGGNFTVVLTVNDGEANAEITAEVRVRDLTGTWSTHLFGGATLELTQSGVNVTGTYRDNFAEGAVSGRVVSPRDVRLIVDVPPFPPEPLNGTANDRVRTITGSDFFGAPSFTFTRQ